MFRTFYTDVKNTFYNPEFYKTIPQKGFSHPFWLLVKLSFISAVVVVVSVIPFVVRFVSEVQQTSQTQYFPEGLEIVIEDGVATTNLPEEPYYIRSDRFGPALAPDKPRTVLMIDTKNDLTLEDISSEEAAFFVMRSAFAFKDKDQIRYFRYEDLFDKRVVINEENTTELVNKIVAELPFVSVLVGIFLLVLITVTGPFGWLFIALPLSLVALIVNYSRKLGLSYRDVFVMSMYALVPAMCVDIITDILFGLQSFSFLLTLAIFTVVLVWNTSPAGVPETTDAP